MSSIHFEPAYTVDRYITFSVRVVSDGFSGVTNFCLLDNTLQYTIETLMQCCSSLSGTCSIRDCDSDDYINVEMLKLGKMRVCGQVGGSYNNQFLRFEFLSDQTVLKQMINELKKCMKK